ncbi:MAG: YbfB/YjiJ family MFS transporter [Candidatus Eiseniibacteriota bacterium]
MARAVSAAGHHSGDMGVWRATLAGLSATLVGIGLARFAYTPLIPALIAANWLSPAAAAYVGAANLIGYLAGALLAPRMAASFALPAVLRAMMLLAAASFFACAFPLSFWWFVVWRGAAGIAGGGLMVLAAPAVLPLVPPERRGLVGGIIFIGVGLGIVASGTLVPLLLQSGLVATWCLLGGLASALTLAAWRGWPAAGPSHMAKGEPATHAPSGHARRGIGLALLGLFLGYGLDAVGIVPHMVFLSDFIARDLGRGVTAGAYFWALFGAGAVVGPALSGHLGDRIGFGWALRLTFATQALCVGLLAVAHGTTALVVSSFVIGASAPGIAPLALGRAHVLASDGASRQAAWRSATIAFAIGQAVAAYGFSFLLAQDVTYPRVFALAAAALVVACTLDVALSMRAHRHHGAPL